MCQLPAGRRLSSLYIYSWLCIMKHCSRFLSYWTLLGRAVSHSKSRTSSLWASNNILNSTGVSRNCGVTCSLLLMPPPLDFTTLFLVVYFLVQNCCSRLGSLSSLSQLGEKVSRSWRSFVKGYICYCQNLQRIHRICEDAKLLRKHSHILLNELDKSLHKEYSCLTCK